MATTTYCVTVKIEGVVIAGFVATAIYDTAVFFAISLRLVSICPGRSWGDKVQEFMCSRSLATIANILWSTGLLYYILVILSIPSVPVPYKNMCLIPEIALQNLMTCRVFRDLKLGYLYYDPADVPTQNTSTIRFAIPLSSPPDENIEIGDFHTTVSMRQGK
ncbi:hypothetical protein QCA50_014302 [Cerrena zonata]|uniref:Uncharacterized protein n=1 Tax=Cerrena zonata TaxID=2478898 RepID=A0AAW0FT86_9APHY